MNINPVVIDLSHYDGPGTDYAKAKAAGIVGVIYKASQGISYQDPTYNAERTKALKAGLKWGAYHFGEKGNVEEQVANFVQTAQVDPDSLFCLDFEPYDPKTMTRMRRISGSIRLKRNSADRANASSTVGTSSRKTSATRLTLFSAAAACG